MSAPLDHVGPSDAPYTCTVRAGHKDSFIVGGNAVVFALGPCAVENPKQVLTIAHAVKKLGAKLLRGGAYKPRTSPYSFQGLKEEGLAMLAEAKNQTGLGIVTEIMSERDIDKVARVADVMQVGARNMQNFALLKALGQQPRPVLLKRGMSATLQEWLYAAEYIADAGNPNIVLCERGIRTFEPSTRNTLDLSAVPVIRPMTRLPIMVDPSHGVGVRHAIGAMAQAAIAAGADGLLIETHHEPHTALCDGDQALDLHALGELVPRLVAVACAVGRSAYPFVPDPRAMDALL